MFRKTESQGKEKPSKKEVKPKKEAKRPRSYSESKLFRTGGQPELLELAEAFQYENLEKNKRKLIANYRITTNSPFMKLLREESLVAVEPAPDVKLMRASLGTKKIEADQAGWKFHISVAPEDIEKAWNLVWPVLVKYNVNDFKVISETVLNRWRSDASLETQAKFANKQMTIYQFKDNHLSKEDWEKIIKEIEEKFIEKGIKTSKFPEIDNPVVGSKYFSYRNDKHPDTGEYMDTAVTLAQAKEYPDRKVYNLRDDKDELGELWPFGAEDTLNMSKS